MKKAIVTGATGFIGSVLVRKLLQHNIEVLALGRKAQKDVDPKRFVMLAGAIYLQLDMCEIDFLPELVKEIGWNADDSCVFYNVAWGGSSGLSDLDIDAQLKNVVWSANAVRAAKILNCKKFIHVGTMEEAFTSKYLTLDFNTNSEYNRHVIYSVAKMTAKKILKLVSRQEKINLIFATNSHVMGPNDDKDSFLQVTLKKLINGDDLIFSAGNQIFDVISVGDLASAYLLIGEDGKPHSDYWVGSGQPRRLREYVEIMAGLYPSGKALQFGKLPYNDISLTKEDLSIELLSQDTGFKPAQTYEETVHELYIWLTKGEYI
jgi:nucleoside-diphosphate-sugar epimerase